MPRKFKKPCAVPGCPNLCEPGQQFCPDHKAVEEKKYNDYCRDKNHNKTYGRSWRNIRNRYLRAHPLCEMCLKEGRYVSATEVHHILPVNKGGDHRLSNLMSLCHSCHEKIHIALNNQISDEG